jgi:CheY-like chemotaxis protein
LMVDSVAFILRPDMNEPRPAPPTLLIVDDEEMVRDTIADSLQGSGYVILHAPSGEAALGMVRAVRVDLILLDYAMPGMNGLEVVRRLKMDPETSRIPVVALTSATASVANELGRSGCVAFIPKPFEPAEFRQLIADIVNETVRRTRRTAGGS